MAKQNTVMTTANISLTESDVFAIKKVAKGGDTVAAISSLASDLVHKYAEGGLMLEKRHLDDIESATGSQIGSPRSLVDEVKKARNFSSDGLVAQATVDPGYLLPLEEVAKANGNTVQDHLNNLFGYFIAEGFVLNLDTFGIKHVAFNRSQMAELENLLGGKPNADMILKALKEVPVGA